MDIKYTDPQTKEVTNVQWDGAKPPTQEDFEQLEQHIQANKPMSTGEVLKGAAANLGSGATFGLSNAIPGAKEAQEKYNTAHPILGLGEQVVGGIAPSFLIPGGGEVEEAGLVAKLLKGAATGAKIGGAYGAGTSLGNQIGRKPIDVGELLKSTATGAVGGGVLGAAAPAIGKVGGMLMEGKGEPIESSKIIAGSMGLQPSTLETIAKYPDFAKEVGPATPAQIVGKYEPNAIKSVKDLYGKLDEMEQSGYKAAGLTDDKKIQVLGNIAKGEGEIYPVVNMQNAVVDFDKTAITSAQKAASEEAKKMLANVSEKIDEGGNLSFGQTKDMTKSFFEKAQSIRAQNGGVDNKESLLFKDMGQYLNRAKNNLPEIQAAGSKYSDIENVRDLLESSFPKLKGETQEVGIKNMLRMRSDERNVEFRTKLNNIESILGKYPESKNLPDFRGDFDKFIAAVDLEKAKSIALKPPIVGKLPFIGSMLTGHVKPTSAAALLARSPLVSREALGSATINTSKNPFIGNALNQLRAYGSVSQMPETAASIYRRMKIPSIMGASTLLQKNPNNGGR